MKCDNVGLFKQGVQGSRGVGPEFSGMPRLETVKTVYDHCVQSESNQGIGAYRSRPGDSSTGSWYRSSTSNPLSRRAI